jgi:hypothetical protein
LLREACLLQQFVPDCSSYIAAHLMQSCWHNVAAAAAGTAAVRGHEFGHEGDAPQWAEGSSRIAGGQRASDLNNGRAVIAYKPAVDKVRVFCSAL